MNDVAYAAIAITILSVLISVDQRAGGMLLLVIVFGMVWTAHKRNFV